MRVFQNWCVLNGVSELPAAPADVARFVTDCRDLGMVALWPIIQEVARAHYVLGLADPTLGGLVSAAIKEIAGLTAPKSWPKEEQARFFTMPYDLQLLVLKRETERDMALKRAQSEAGNLRNELKKAQKPAKVTDGNQSHAAA